MVSSLPNHVTYHPPRHICSPCLESNLLLGPEKRHRSASTAASSITSYGFLVTLHTVRLLSIPNETTAGSVSLAQLPPTNLTAPSQDANKLPVETTSRGRDRQRPANTFQSDFHLPSRSCFGLSR